MLRGPVFMLSIAMGAAYVLQAPRVRPAFAGAEQGMHSSSSLTLRATRPVMEVEEKVKNENPTSWDREGLLKIASGEVFGIDNARLPAPPMLMMSRILETSEDGGLHGKGHVVAEFDITPDLWFFECHFPGDPIMPGCLGLDGLWQLTGYNLAWRNWQGRGYALGVGEVKLLGMVRPDRKLLRYEVSLVTGTAALPLLFSFPHASHPRWRPYSCAHTRRSTSPRPCRRAGSRWASPTARSSLTASRSTKSRT